MNSSETNYHFK